MAHLKAILCQPSASWDSIDGGYSWGSNSGRFARRSVNARTAEIDQVGRQTALANRALARAQSYGRSDDARDSLRQPRIPAVLHDHTPIKVVAREPVSAALPYVQDRWPAETGHTLACRYLYGCDQPSRSAVVQEDQMRIAAAGHRGADEIVLATLIQLGGRATRLEPGNDNAPVHWRASGVVGAIDTDWARTRDVPQARAGFIVGGIEPARRVRGARVHRCAARGAAGFVPARTCPECQQRYANESPSHEDRLPCAEERFQSDQFRAREATCRCKQIQVITMLDFAITPVLSVARMSRNFVAGNFWTGHSYRHAYLGRSPMRYVTLVWVRGSLGLFLSLAGCTQLGPMPATTAMSVVQAGRPDLELQAGLVPGYYLSSAVERSPDGTTMSQLAALFEPDRLLSLPGVVAGARYAGDGKSGPSIEPMLGYRRAFGADRALSLGVFGYGTHAQSTRHGASYSATRAGVETGIDLRATPQSYWLEIHFMPAVSLTGLSASGTYCLDAAGQYGADCPDTNANPVRAQASGFYPSVSGTIALDIAHHLNTFFHGVRLAAQIATGTMPTVVAADQKNATSYVSSGLTFTLGFGAVQR